MRVWVLGLIAAALLPWSEARAEAPPVALERSQVREVGGYRVQIQVPAGEAPAEGRPVIYALDGDWTFATFTDALRIQSNRPEVTGVRPAVLVGIAMPEERRQAELTPPGSARLLEVLEQRLMPMIEGEFGVDARRRTLFGHSLGGLFVLDVLLKRPELFAAYAAASPSIWWKDQAILAEAGAALRRERPSPGPAVLITVGEHEQFPPGVSAETAARLAKRRQVDAAAEMAGILSAAGLPTELVVFAGENHGSVIPAAVSRTVRFAQGGR